jgi:pyrroline-5-carboxylate reductase
MLCVKPKDIVKLLKETSNEFRNNHLILSIAAGIQLSQLQKVIKIGFFK